MTIPQSQVRGISDGGVSAAGDRARRRAPELLRAARSALRDKNGGAETVVEHNRITTGRLQLRLGRDLRWFPYARSDGEWEPSGPPDSDPARAVADL